MVGSHAFFRMVSIAALVFAMTAGAQPSSPPPTPPAPLAAPDNPPVKIRSIDNYIHAVVDLDKSVAFYRDVIGLKVKKPASDWSSLAVFAQITNTPGSKFRSATMELPGTHIGLLLAEFGNAKREIIAPRNCDSGASTMAITLRDFDKVMSAAAAAKTSIVTAGGEPLNMGPESRVIFLKDPDGFFIELNTQAMPGAALALQGNVSAVRIGFATPDTATTQNFYHDTLGFEYRPAAPTFWASKLIGEMVGVPGLELKAAFGKLPGTTLQWEFLQFRGVPLKSYEGGMQDPGTPAISLLVADADAAVQTIEQAGGKVITIGGKPLPLGPHAKAALVRDPNGILLELTQRM